MSRRNSTISVTWGDTPLGRIASTNSLSDLPLADIVPDRASPVNYIPYRRQSSHIPTTHNRMFHKGRHFRRHSSASILKSPQLLDEIDKRRLNITTISDHGSEINFDYISEGSSETDETIPEGKPSYNCPSAVYKIQITLKEFVKKNEKILKRLVKLMFVLLYIAYFSYAMYHSFGDEGSLRLLVCTVFGLLLILLNPVSQYIWRGLDFMCLWHERPVTARAVRWVFYIAAVTVIVITLIVLVAMKNPRNLLSLPGLFVFVIITFITSTNPTKVEWHPVFWGLTFQYLFGVVVLYTDWGVGVCQYLSERVVELLDYSDEGADYVFGETRDHHRFAFSVLSVTVFFSTLVSILYHIGVMQATIRVIGRTLSFCFHASPIEALNLAGNIFIGFAEAPLLIRPFVPAMTRSELHTVMTAGFATVAGSMLTVYAQYGIPTHHLLASCVMSAPAALAISKLSCPETEKTKSSLEDYIRLEGSSTSNIIESVTSGATSAVKLVASVAVNVLAFLCVFKFITATLMWFGDRIGIYDLTFEFLSSYLFFPLALFMGVDLSDCRQVGELLGVKIFTNELSSYSVLFDYINNRKMFDNYTMTQNLTDWFQDNQNIILPSWNVTLYGGILSERSEIISSYALCGFSNIGSIGIMLGVLGALAPHKKLVLTQIVIRALVAGNVACFITACTAGLLHKTT